MSSNDRPNILAMIDSISRISEYVEGLSSAEEYHGRPVVFDATLMNFVVIGEMVDRLSPALRAEHPDVDWQKIKDFRNLVAHDYLGIDAEEVWQIIQDELPAFGKQLRKVLELLPPDSEQDAESRPTCG